MAPNPFDLSGRTALVTGGGSGLGLAIARGLAQSGANVVISGRRRHRLSEAVATLAGLGIATRAFAFDVADESAVAEGIAAVERDVGPLDILINNAAVNTRQPFEAFTIDDWRAMQATNVEGAFLVTRALLPGMKARRCGKIVNICSLAADLGRANISAYAASKGALKAITRSLAVELAPHNIQVNGIVPGFFRTEMNSRQMDDPEFSAWVERRTPAGRWAEPRELAGAVVFLCSSAADYVTGHMLHVDGGFAAAY